MQVASALGYSAEVPQPVTHVLNYAQAHNLGPVTAHQLLQLQRLTPRDYPVLLQSAAAGASGHHHDVLMAFPQQRLTLYANDQLHGPDPLLVRSNELFLDVLDQWWHEHRVTSHACELPFSGGWFLFLGYELAKQIEPSLQVHRGNAREIVAQAVRIPVAVVRNSVTGEAWFIAEHEYADKLDTVVSQLQQIPALPSSPMPSAMATAIQEEASELFLHAANRSLEHIAAGDIYQANLSRAWTATLQPSISPQDVYQQLCVANPAPFAGIAILADDNVVISSSPERLLKVRQHEVSTRPIAGTRPRSTDHQRDQQLIDELRNNPKEQAEHIMLLDLERNDLGRICQAGTVQVDEFMTVETYAHVHHIVSNVHGTLRNDIIPGQAIAAVFPGGTITGCPKVRCMQVIAELEKVPRGAYTGSMGYLNRDGSMDLNILIRSLHQRGNQLQFRAGAGIVADSIPERELDETRAKALGMLRALGISMSTNK